MSGESNSGGERATPDRAFDVVVVGAGINGTGIARDAARRGLKVLLLDKQDIAAGTTSWSSRLIHGGLRYLEHAEIGLVHESLVEREHLLSIAPHLVRPLPLTLPIYRYHTRGPLLIRLGMIAYDLLSFRKSLPRHRMFGRDQALIHEPGLNADGLRAAARYYDAQVEFPERISVENTIDAHSHGAEIRTDATVDRLVMDGHRVVGVGFVDRMGNRNEIQAALTINVAGPWVDDVLAGVERGPAERLVGATKGSHIVVAPFPGAPTDALYIEAKQDNRPYFIIPWNRHYLIGTTDVRYDGDPDRVVPSEEEIFYLLTETNTAIPAANLSRGDVLYAYAGLRPLPQHCGGSESAITRRHIVKDHAPDVEGLVSIIGGKLTTFRNLAEQTVDLAVRKLGRKVSPSDTASVPLPGGVSRMAAFAARFGADRPDWLDERSASYLLRVYGSRARNVVALGEVDPALRTIIHEETGTIAATVAHAVRTEFAETLTDVIMRRTMVGYAGDAGMSAVDPILDTLRRSEGWTTDRCANERLQHLTYMERFMVASPAPVSFAPVASQPVT